MKHQRMVLITIVALLLTSACGTAEMNTGYLQGTVTIGPLTPVQKAGETPAAPPVDLLTSNGIEILREGRDTVYRTVHFNADASYSVELPAGEYTVRLISKDLLHASKLPTSVTITRDQVTILNIDIDTSIR